MTRKQPTDQWLVMTKREGNLISARTFDYSCDPVDLAIKYAFDETDWNTSRAIHDMKVEQLLSRVEAKIDDVTVTVQQVHGWTTPNLDSEMASMIATIKAGAGRPL